MSTNYGYGWAIFPTPQNNWLITHNGGNGIFSAISSATSMKVLPLSYSATGDVISIYSPYKTQSIFIITMYS